jgi:hypothetical protein
LIYYWRNETADGSIHVNSSGGSDQERITLQWVYYPVRTWANIIVQVKKKLNYHYWNQNYVSTENILN